MPASLAIERLEGMATETELAWLAGFIDGEGTIYITHGRDQQMLFLRIGNTHVPSLEKIKKICRVGYIGLHSGGRGRLGKREVYKWSVQANQALKVLQKVFPYLVTKKAQAEIAIAFQSHKNSRRKTGCKRLPRYEVEDDLKFREAIHLLNKGLKDSVELPAVTQRRLFEEAKGEKEEA